MIVKSNAVRNKYVYRHYIVNSSVYSFSVILTLTVLTALMPIEVVTNYNNAYAADEESGIEST